MEGLMDRDIRVLSLAALAAAILMPVVAAAQAPPKSKAPVAPTTEQLDPKACTQERETVGMGGDLDTQGPQGNSLSDRLARSDGVICPPSHVDPEITAPTPPGGPMPVIPPPGSPGGDPSIQPK
jgi:hypothetical protein